LYRKPHPIHEADILCTPLQRRVINRHRQDTLVKLRYGRCLRGVSGGDHPSTPSNSLGPACPTLPGTDGNLKWNATPILGVIWLTRSVTGGRKVVWIVLERNASIW